MFSAACRCWGQMALHCMNWFHFHFPRKSKAANTHVFREGRRLPEPFLRHGFITQFLNHVKSSPGWTEWWRRAICFQSFQAGLLCCVAESSQAAQSGFSLSSDAGAGKHPKSSASWGHVPAWSLAFPGKAHAAQPGTHGLPVSVVSAHHCGS